MTYNLTTLNPSILNGLTAANYIDSIPGFPNFEQYTYIDSFVKRGLGYYTNVDILRIGFLNPSSVTSILTGDAFNNLDFVADTNNYSLYVYAYNDQTTDLLNQDVDFTLNTGTQTITLLRDCNVSSIIGLYFLYLNKSQTAVGLLNTDNFATKDLTATTARTHTLVDNTAAALKLESSGATGLLTINTTNSSEAVEVNGKLKVTGSGSTATTLSGRDSSNLLTNVTVGSGLSLSSGTLSATGGYTDSQAVSAVNTEFTNSSATTGAEVAITANAITSGSALDIGVNGTAAASNTQTGTKITLQGANATSGQTTYGLNVSNTHTGTNSTNVGGRFNASGGTTNYSILLGEDTAQTIVGGRRTTDANGSDLTIQAGGAYTGGTNRSGGSLVLNSGICTGTGSSSIKFNVVPNTVSGSTDTAFVQRMTLTSTGLSIGTTSPSYRLDTAGSAHRFVKNGSGRGTDYTASFQNMSESWSYVEIVNSTAGTTQGVGGLLMGINTNTAYFHNRNPGNTELATTSTAGQLGTTKLRINNTTAVPASIYYGGNGTTTVGTETWPTTSIYSMTADATAVANTTTATTVCGTGVGTRTIPTGFFTAGRRLKFEAAGILSCVSAPNLDMRIVFGATTVNLVALTALPDLTNATWTFTSDIICRSTGASGSFIGLGEFTYISGTEKVTVPVAISTSTIDTTAAVSTDMTAQWSVASASNTITGKIATLSIIN